MNVSAPTLQAVYLALSKVATDDRMARTTPALAGDIGCSVPLVKRAISELIRLGYVRQDDGWVHLTLKTHRIPYRCFCLMPHFTLTDVLERLMHARFGTTRIRGGMGSRAGKDREKGLKVLSLRARKRLRAQGVKTRKRQLARGPRIRYMEGIFTFLDVDATEHKRALRDARVEWLLWLASCEPVIEWEGALTLRNATAKGVTRFTNVASQVRKMRPRNGTVPEVRALDAWLSVVRGTTLLWFLLHVRREARKIPCDEAWLVRLLGTAPRMRQRKRSVTAEREERIVLRQRKMGAEKTRRSTLIKETGTFVHDVPLGLRSRVLEDVNKIVKAGK